MREPFVEFKEKQRGGKRPAQTALTACESRFLSRTKRVSAGSEIRKGLLQSSILKNQIKGKAAENRQSDGSQQLFPCSRRECRKGARASPLRLICPFFKIFNLKILLLKSAFSAAQNLRFEDSGRFSLVSVVNRAKNVILFLQVKRKNRFFAQNRRILSIFALKCRREVCLWTTPPVPRPC